jgi:hypothetical protein
MKRSIAGLLTVALMGLLLWSGVRRPASTATPSTSETDASQQQTNPAEARVQALLETARAGDVAAYLASFAGPLRDRLEREAADRGRDAFAADLRRAAFLRKSHAVFAVEPEGSDSARVTVETVYPDRNERQTYRLEPRDKSWLVTEVETVRSHQPKAKFGTPASYIAPEGVPVQSGGVVVETGDEPSAAGATSPPEN